MRFVDDDGEAPAALLVANLVENEGELLHRRDDDFLARLDEAAQVSRVLCVAHGGAHLGVLADGVSDLLVEDSAVGHQDDGVEDRRVVLLVPDELVREPGDRVALAAAGGVRIRRSRGSSTSQCSSGWIRRAWRSTPLSRASAAGRPRARRCARAGIRGRWRSKRGSSRARRAVPVGRRRSMRSSPRRGGATCWARCAPRAR